MNCYLCEKGDITVFREKLRHGELRNVLKCGDCGIMYLEPQETGLKEYYADEYRKQYSPVIGQAVASRDIFNMYLPYQQRRIDHILPILKPDMKVLEVGCSAGHFLHSIRPHVAECIGIEYNRNDAEFVNTELGIKTYSEPIENTDIPLGYFDLAVVLQTLEHMADPREFLRTISKYLKPGGHLFVEVPNVNEALLSVYDISTYGDFYFKEPHIFYFSPNTLTALMDDAGFHGDVATTQRYSLFNHMHWMMTGQPQKSAEVGMSTPGLAKGQGLGAEIRDELNAWACRVDDEYKTLLNKYRLGESVVFIGTNGVGN